MAEKVTILEILKETKNNQISTQRPPDVKKIHISGRFSTKISKVCETITKVHTIHNLSGNALEWVQRVQAPADLWDTYHLLHLLILRLLVLHMCTRWL